MIYVRDAQRNSRTALISPTIRNASRLSFYQQHWTGISLEDIRTVHDLKHLRPLNKAQALDMLETFEYDEPPALLSHSSGTSSGTITTRCRSLEELRFLWNVRRGSVPTDENGEMPLILAVDGANHGQQLPTPSASFGLKAVGFDFHVIDHVVQQLTKTYRFPGFSNRVKAIDAPLGFAKLLTFELHDRGIDPAGLGVELLTTYGEYVTDDWSRRLEKLWGAAHVDRYAMSEVVGGATRCRRCGWLTFSPESWPEVISPVAHSPIADGIGLLAITELFPFSQLQPMVRFIPGDLVEIRGSDCDLRPARTIRFLGRYDRALIDDAAPHDVILYPTEVFACLDSSNLLEREPVFHTLPLRGEMRDLAPPYAEFRVDKGSGRSIVVISVVPKFSATCFPDAGNRLRSDLTDNLLEACTGLRESVRKARYDIVVEFRRDPSNMKGFLPA